MEKNPGLRRALDKVLNSIENAVNELTKAPVTLAMAGMTQEAAGITRQITALGGVRERATKLYCDLCELEGLTP